MTTMYDSANDPAAIPVRAGAAILYPIDGIFAGNYPPAVVDEFTGGACPYSVQATAALDLPVVFYDVENGDAPIGEVITALKAREAARLISGVYCSDVTHSQVVAPAMGAAALTFTPGSSWPTPGIYLGLAEPTGNPHVTPPSVFTQYLWAGTYDASACASAFPVVPAPDPPPPPGPAPAPSPSTEVAEVQALFEVNGGTYITNGLFYRWLRDEWDLNAVKIVNPSIPNLGPINGFKGMGVPTDPETASLSGQAWPVAGPAQP